MFNLIQTQHIHVLKHHMYPINMYNFCYRSAKKTHGICLAQAPCPGPLCHPQSIPSESQKVSITRELWATSAWPCWTQSQPLSWNPHGKRKTRVMQLGSLLCLVRRYQSLIFLERGGDIRGAGWLCSFLQGQRENQGSQTVKVKWTPVVIPAS